VLTGHSPRIPTAQHPSTPGADPRPPITRSTVISESRQPAVVVDRVARSFGEVAAVRAASLQVHAGSVTGLVGPNGSGKTTLLLMLATLLTPDAGTIRICGHDPVTDPAAVRRVIGWMPDVLGSWPSLTVRTALEVTGRMYQLDRQEAAARAEALIRLTDLSLLADHPARVLSRGQKQKLSLARSLVHRPSVLLLDEPASGLDPQARVELRRLVRRLADEGTAVLISSHVLSELDEMADSAVYVTAGVTADAETLAQVSTRRDWRVRALDDWQLANALAATGLPPERVTRDGLGTLLSLDGDEHAARVLARLVAEGAQLTAFAPAVGDLEHTFLDLNRRTTP